MSARSSTCGEVAVGHGVTEQVPGLLELVEQGLVAGELDAVAGRRPGFAADRSRAAIAGARQARNRARGLWQGQLRRRLLADERPDAIGDRRGREAPGQQRLDLAPALVASGLDELGGAFVIELRPEDRDHRQRERARAQVIQYDWKAPRRPRRVDAPEGGALRVAQGLAAVHVQRGVTEAEMEVAGLDLAQVGHDLGAGIAFPRDQGAGAGQQIVVGEVAKADGCVHDLRITHHVFGPPGWARRAANALRLDFSPGGIDRRAQRARGALARTPGGARAGGRDGTPKFVKKKVTTVVENAEIDARRRRQALTTGRREDRRRRRLRLASVDNARPRRSRRARRALPTAVRAGACAPGPVSSKNWSGTGESDRAGPAESGSDAGLLVTAAIPGDGSELARLRR